MDELVWAVNARNDTVEGFAYYVAQFAEEHVIAAGLRCRLLLPPDLPPRALAADVRRTSTSPSRKPSTTPSSTRGRPKSASRSGSIPHALVVEVADDGCGLPADLGSHGQRPEELPGANGGRRAARGGGVGARPGAPGSCSRRLCRGCMYMRCRNAARGGILTERPMNTPLRIGIVEDDPHLRADFTKLISRRADMACVAGFGSAEEALVGLPAVNADVMLVDINLPGMSGIELVRRMRTTATRAQIVMLTTFDDATTVFESLKAGANGYVLKRAVLGELIDAIRDVASGGAPMTSAIARKVVQSFGQRGPAPEVEALTDREREVLVALSQGQRTRRSRPTLASASTPSASTSA